MPSLTWVDEVADWPVWDEASWKVAAGKIYGGLLPQPGKWNGGVIPSNPGLPERPAPRWRRDLRRAPGLKRSSQEILFRHVHFDPTGVQTGEFRMKVDGVPWRGRWILMDMKIEHPYHEMSTFGSISPKYVPTGPSTMTIKIHNMDAPGQAMTFELSGAWTLAHCTETGAMTLSYGKQLEMKAQ